ncbi:MAG TPA: hypothetical protein VN113_07190, partial [Caulobacter sp.]|nr:hypothetical protein [Caulobacter sp.]
MVHARRTVGVLKTCRPGAFWALLAGLLLVTGLAAPGPAATRPAVEYRLARDPGSVTPRHARVAKVAGTLAAHAAAVLFRG